MKANEAPEKIYIQSFNVSEEDVKFARNLYFDDVWTEEPESGQENIEYIRTDAFIEKAAEWMFSQANVYSVTHVSNDGSIYTNFYADKMIEDFRKNMKGE